MKWFLIIVVTSLGGVFSPDDVTQQKLGPYTTKESCLEAARSVPKELRWKSGGEWIYMAGTTARVNAFCVSTEK